VFTVRSSTALTPLPAGGIWCDNSGKVKQQSVIIVRSSTALTPLPAGGS